MKVKKIIVLISSVICIILFFYLENNLIAVNKINVTSNKLPESFSGYRIIHLSDLHSKAFGKDGAVLLNKVKNLKPDIIVCTGDLIDAKKYNEKDNLELMAEMMKIAPVYFVTGNHEWWSGKFNTLEEKLQKIGVNILRNENEKLKRQNDSIIILGVDDPEGGPIESNTAIALGEIKGNNEFVILLSHRPEYINMYSKYNLDLVLCGHAHGGQVRLPYLGGLIAPNQGFLPKYTAGKYQINDTIMIVSRGLGNSIIPQRIFNRPEIVSIVLWRK